MMHSLSSVPNALLRVLDHAAGSMSPKEREALASMGFGDASGVLGQVFGRQKPSVMRAINSRIPGVEGNIAGQVVGGAQQ
jgi:hypothetical protein